MNQRFPDAETEKIRSQYADDGLFKAVCQLGDHFQMQTGTVGLKAEECYRDVRTLLDTIAEEGPAALPLLGNLYAKQYNKYKDWDLHAVEQDLLYATGIIFIHAAHAVTKCHIPFYRTTATRILIETVQTHSFDKLDDTVLRIFALPLPDDWFDRFIAEGGEDAGEMKVGETPAAFDIISELQVIFHNNREEALAFIRRIDGAKSTFITEEVNRLLREEKITKAGCKRDLWRILHDNGYYKIGESTWNRQVNA